MVWLPVRAFLRSEPPSRTPIFSQPVIRTLTGIFLFAATIWLLGGIDVGPVEVREMATETVVAGPPNPIKDFLYWPYYFLVWLVDSGLGNWLSSARLVSVFWGWLAIVGLMVILRRWSNSSLAIGGGILLASNSWFLGLAKVGSPEIMLIAVPLLTGAIIIRFWQRWHRLRATIGLVAIFVIGWFLPVWPWFLLGLLLWRLSRPIPGWRLRLWLAGAMASLGAGSLWALSQTPGLVRDWSGFSSSWPSLSGGLDNLGQVVASLAWQAPHRPYWLADLPLADVLGVVLLVFGLGSLWRAASGWSRLAGLAGIGVWLTIVGLGGGVDSSGFFLIGGGAFIVMGVGLVELWAIWQRVFPVNPIAHLIGFGFLISLVGLSAFYQGFRYLVVEPRYRQLDPSITSEVTPAVVLPVDDSQETEL